MDHFVSKQELYDLLTVAPTFEGLDGETKRRLTKIAAPRRFDKSGVILNQGEQMPGMYLIATGIVKVSRLSRTGREHILIMLRSGDTFNDVTVLDAGPNPATAIAYTDCSIWYFSGDALIETAGKHPEVALSLARNVSKYSRYLVQEVDGLSMCSVKARLARFLLNQSMNGDQVHLVLTQEELASHLGTVREVVGRTLRTLKNDGLIQSHSESIRILDRERLIFQAEL